MKHIKTYKIFESFQEVTKDDMDSLVDTLTTEIFDEFDIYQWIDVDKWKDKSPYWEIYGLNKNKITIGNLKSDVYTQVINILFVIRKIVYGRTGLEYTIHHEVISGRGFIGLTIFNDSSKYANPYD